VTTPLRHHLTNSESAVILGSTTPRLWTPPLRELTPETSFGYDVIDFARDVLEEPLDPWQEWLVIHAGELLEDGRPRFRTVLTLVARQNGKTHLSRVLILYWLFVEQVPLILGTSTTIAYAKEVWAACINIVKDNPYLQTEIGPNFVRAAIGEETLTTLTGSRYKVSASNRRAGRSLTVHRLVLDELREHSDWDAWNASTHAMNAVPYGQVWCVTNQCDDKGVVLDSLRDSAIDYLETGNGDPRLGIFEWSAPNGCDPTDVHALAASNPNLGRRVDTDALVGAARRAKASGGQELASFRTEVLCQRVIALDSAIDPDRWDALGTSNPVGLANHRNRLALCLDVSLDGSHASLVGAAVVDGIVHIEVIEAWEGFGCTKQLREELPDLIERVKPRTLGWFPAGPAGSIAADIADRGYRNWPPKRVTISEIRGETTSVCMGLAEQVTSGQIRHPDDPMLTAHVRAAQKLNRGDGWVFTRRNAGPVDGAYATAGAVHLARTLPPPRPPLVVL
jgi:phage terminase large subunit-like protein